jgi:hypothetical protein
MGTTGLPEGDLTPDISELQGRDEALPDGPVPAVPVDVVGPVRTQRLPNKAFAVRQAVLVTGSEPIQLVKKDLTRARVTLRAKGGDVYIAPTRDQAAQSLGLLADGNQLVLETTAAVWVFSVAASVTVSAWSEQWTD